MSKHILSWILPVLNSVFVFSEAMCVFVHGDPNTDFLCMIG